MLKALGVEGLFWVTPPSILIESIKKQTDGLSILGRELNSRHEDKFSLENNAEGINTKRWLQGRVLLPLPEVNRFYPRPTPYGIVGGWDKIRVYHIQILKC